MASITSTSDQNLFISLKFLGTATSEKVGYAPNKDIFTLTITITINRTRILEHTDILQKAVMHLTKIHYFVAAFYMSSQWPSSAIRH